MRLLCLFLLITIGCRFNNSVVENETQARQLLDSIIAADNRSDLPAVLSFYTNDAILMPANKPSIKGIEAIEQNYKSIFEGSILRLESHVEEIKTAADWAAITGFNTGTVYLKKDSSTVTVNDKFIILLEKQENTWKIKRLIWNKNSY